MKRIIVILIVSVTCFIFACKTCVKTDYSWIDGENNSCEVACKKAGLQPVVSGKYKNGHPFYVCSANAHGEGYRGGYNLRPNWNNVCVVGWGSSELLIQEYKCLCK